VVIYITTLQSKYIVITVCDSILHEYYITRTYQNMIYKIFIRYNIGRGSRAGKGSREFDQEKKSEDLLLGRQAYARFRSWDLLRFCCALRSASKNSLTSKLCDLDMQVQGCQNATQRVHKNAKWHAQK